MTEGSIWRSLLLFFFPLMAGTFFQMLYNTADTMIVGRYVGTVALSAVGGAAASLMALFVGFFVGLSTGASVLAAQCFGGKKYKELQNAVHTAMALAGVLGTAMAMFSFFMAPLLLTLMRTPADSFSASVLYLRIISIGIVPNMIYNMGAGIFRAVGDSKRPFLFLIFSSVLNIALDLLFVAVFSYGVAGAAIATVISQLLCAALVTAVMMRTEAEYRLSPGKIRFHRPSLRKILRIGIPTAQQSKLYNLSNAFIMSYVNGFGTASVAAWGICNKVDALYWMMTNCLGISITTFTGQNYGAGKMDRVYRGVKESLALCGIFSILIGAILFYAAPVIMPAFTNDPEVIALGITVVRFFARLYSLWICVEVFSGILRGMGDMLAPTLITMIGVCVLRILWCAVMVPRRPDILTVSWSYPVTWTVSSISFIIYFIYRERKLAKG